MSAPPNDKKATPDEPAPKKGGRTAADRRRIQGAKHEEVQAVEVKGAKALRKPKMPYSEDIGHMRPAKDPLLKKVTKRTPPKPSL